MGDIILVVGIVLIITLVSLARRQRTRTSTPSTPPAREEDNSKKQPQSWQEKIQTHWLWKWGQNKKFILVVLFSWITFLLLMGETFPSFWARALENFRFFVLLNFGVLGITLLLGSGGQTGRKILGFSMAGLLLLATIGTALGEKPGSVEEWLSEKLANVKTHTTSSLSYLFCQGWPGGEGVQDFDSLPPIQFSGKGEENRCFAAILSWSIDRFSANVAEVEWKHWWTPENETYKTNGEFRCTQVRGEEYLCQGKMENKVHSESRAGVFTMTWDPKSRVFFGITEFLPEKPGHFSRVILKPR